MRLFERLQKYLTENMGECPPDIRYFNGPEIFATPGGRYCGKTIEESLDIFLKSKSY